MSFSILITRRWTAVLLVGVVLLIGSSVGRALYQRTQLQAQIHDLQQSIQIQQKEQGQYKELLDKIDDFAYIEREARLTFGLKQPGEGVLVVPDSVIGIDTQSSVASAPSSNPQRWWNYFFSQRNS